jgi:hypothetical protein
MEDVYLARKRNVNGGGSNLEGEKRKDALISGGENFIDEKVGGGMFTPTKRCWRCWPRVVGRKRLFCQFM